MHRLELAPLSRAAVGDLAAGTGRDADAVHALTRGNPFFVAEALAAPPDEVPANVKDAVLARVRLLSPDCRDALERLSVIPSTIPTDAGRRALGALDPLAEAELAGLIELRGDGGLGFRHELARRAIEQSLPALRRRLLNRAVVAALRARGRPDRGRLLHHAAEAGDVETLLAEGPAAAREAARAGSHRQALAHFEAVVPHADRLPLRERAEFLNDYGWELYNAHRFRASVDASRAAERLFREVGEPIPLALCLVRLSRHLFMAGATDAAEEAAQRAVVTLIDVGDDAALAYATLYLGAILAQTPARGGDARCSSAPTRSRWRSQRPDLAALCLNYLAIARVEAGEPDGLQTMRNSIALAQAGAHHEATARGYCNLAELLLRMGRLDELERCVHEGLTFTRERGFWSHAYNLEVHRCLLLLRRGDWEPARERACARCSTPTRTRGCSSPTARRGSAGCSRAAATPAAGPLLADAWEQAQRQRLLLGLAYAGIARAEWAWLTGDLDAARQVAAVLLPRTEHPGAAPFRGELLRYLARAGLPAEPFEGCPPGYDAGLRGDWRAAAAAWRRAGDPYETALELAERRRRGVRRGAAAPSSASARRPRPSSRPRPPARARRLGPARPARGHPGQPGGPDGPPARRARAAARRPHERRDRRAARPLGPHRRPPRRGDPGEARRLLPPRSRRLDLRHPLEWPQSGPLRRPFRSGEGAGEAGAAAGEAAHDRARGDAELRAVWP